MLHPEKRRRKDNREGGYHNNNTRALACKGAKIPSFSTSAICDFKLWERSPCGVAAWERGNILTGSTPFTLQHTLLAWYTTRTIAGSHGSVVRTDGPLRGDIDSSGRSRLVPRSWGGDVKVCSCPQGVLTVFASAPQRSCVPQRVASIALVSTRPLRIRPLRLWYSFRVVWSTRPSSKKGDMICNVGETECQFARQTLALALCHQESTIMCLTCAAQPSR